MKHPTTKTTSTAPAGLPPDEIKIEAQRTGPVPFDDTVQKEMTFVETDNGEIKIVLKDGDF